MKKKFIILDIHLDLPDGETPDIDIGLKADAKVSAALQLLLDAGCSEYSFSVVKMDIEDGSAFVLTHEDA